MYLAKCIELCSITPHPKQISFSYHRDGVSASYPRFRIAYQRRIGENLQCKSLVVAQSEFRVLITTLFECGDELIEHSRISESIQSFEHDI